MIQMSIRNYIHICLQFNLPNKHKSKAENKKILFLVKPTEATCRRIWQIEIPDLGVKMGKGMRSPNLDHTSPAQATCSLNHSQRWELKAADNKGSLLLIVALNPEIINYTRLIRRTN